MTPGYQDRQAESCSRAWTAGNGLPVHGAADETGKVPAGAYVDQQAKQNASTNSPLVFSVAAYAPSAAPRADSIRCQVGIFSRTHDHGQDVGVAGAMIEHAREGGEAVGVGRPVQRLLVKGHDHVVLRLGAVYDCGRHIPAPKARCQSESEAGQPGRVQAASENIVIEGLEEVRV